MTDTAPPTLLTQVLPGVAPTGDAYKFGEAPAAQGELKALTPDDMGARMYGDPAVKHKMAASIMERGALDRLQTTEGAKAEAAGLLQVLARHDIGDSVPVAEAFVAYRANPPDAARVADWEAKSRDYLKAEYGAEAGNVLARTQRMLKADPVLDAALKKTGLGSNPDIVKALTASAERMRMAGKLR